MIKVSIFKTTDLLNSTHGATFPTQAEADAWLAEGTRQEWWGKAAYTEIIPAVTEMQEVIVTPAVLDGEGNVVTPAVKEMQEVVVTPEQVIEHPAEYTVVIEDISAQIIEKNKVAARAKRRAFGENLIDKISTINDSKSLTVEQVDAFMSDALITNLREHLWAGNIDTFISKLQSSDVSAFFSTEEKAAVILECQAFLTSLQEA